TPAPRRAVGATLRPPSAAAAPPRRAPAAPPPSRTAPVRPPPAPPPRYPRSAPGPARPGRARRFPTGAAPKVGATADSWNVWIRRRAARSAPPAAGPRAAPIPGQHLTGSSPRRLRLANEPRREQIGDQAEHHRGDREQQGIPL